MREQGNTSPDCDLFGIFCDGAPVDECEFGLPIVEVQTCPNVVTIRLIRNLNSRWRAKFELQLKLFAVPCRRTKIAEAIPITKLARMPSGTHREMMVTPRCRSISGTWASRVK